MNDLAAPGAAAKKGGRAGVAEQVDARVSKTRSLGSVSSSLTARTTGHRRRRSGKPARWLRRIGAVCLAAWAALALWADASAQTPAPHRALYQMRLATAESSSDIVGADGEMYFEWTRVCDGWRVNQHVRLRLALGESESRTVGLLFSGWEAFDGQAMRFALRRTSDDATVEEIVGEAAVDDRGGEARFVKPTKARLALPRGTLFPTDYARRVLRRLAAGESRARAPVFDGSTVEGAYDVTTFFGRPRRRPLLALAPGGGIDDLVWPLRSAYFMYGQSAPQPLFEVGELVTAGGIAHSVDLDYDRYTVRAELTRFEAVPAPAC